MFCTAMRLSLGAGVLLLFSGCGGEGGYTDYAQSDKGTPAPAHEHDHEHEHGPHDGHLIHLGDHEYHGEVCFDAKEKKLTVYILGHEVSKPHPIPDKEITLSLKIDGKPALFTLVAVPLEGEPEGMSSRFELAGDLAIAEHIRSEEDLEGSLTVTIDGKPYSGDIAHHHDDHDHAHEPKGEKEGGAK